MRPMNQDEREERWLRIPSYSLMPFVSTEELTDWIENARKVVSKVSYGLGLNTGTRVNYISRAVTMIDNSLGMNASSYCSVPVDIMLALHLTYASNEQRIEIAKKLHKWYAKITKVTPDIKELPDLGREYPINQPARKTLAYGHIGHASKSIATILDMFRGIQLAMFGRSAEADLVIDQLLMDITPEWITGLGILSRHATRFDSHGERVYLPEHQVYRMYKKDELGGSVLLCTAPMPLVGELLKTILTKTKNKHLERKIHDPKTAVYKLLGIMFSTVSKTPLQSKKMGVVYSRELIW